MYYNNCNDRLFHSDMSLDSVTVDIASPPIGVIPGGSASEADRTSWQHQDDSQIGHHGVLEGFVVSDYGERQLRRQRDHVDVYMRFLSHKDSFLHFFLMTSCGSLLDDYGFRRRYIFRY